jgi:hypothetical protein
LVSVGKNTRQAVTLTTRERTELLRELDFITATAGDVGDGLELAARRHELALTSWTDEQLDTLIRAARNLRGAVERAPITPG